MQGFGGRTWQRAMRHLSRQSVGWLALCMAMTGTSFAAVSATAVTPIVPSTSEPSVAWVKLNASGSVADSSGATFTTRRTTNGTYEISFSGYRAADCAATVQVQETSDANRILAETEEHLSKLEVRTYLAYTSLIFDAPTTVVFNCA